MKPQIRLVAAGALALALAAPAANADIAVTLNGQPLATSVPPIQVNYRTLVPMRDIFEALGATLQWNNVSQTITAQKDITQIQLGINNPNAVVNGRAVTLDQPPILVEGRTYVPLRFVSEALDAQVEWNTAFQTVAIKTKPVYAAAPPSQPVPVVPPAYQPPANNYPVYQPPVTQQPANNYPVNPLPATDPRSPLYIPPAQPQPARYDDVTVPANVVIPVSFDRALSSATARVGDTFTVSPVSRRIGDSEFPAGTKIEGMVTESQPRNGNQPGVLDFAFRSAILPDGTRVPLSGSLVSLDDNSVVNQNGRVVAKAGKGNGVDLKVIGIGAGAGWVLGKVLDTNKTVTTILGAAGGYLVGRNQNQKAEEATIKAGTSLGVRLDDSVTYRDTSSYNTYRTGFLRNGTNRFDARDYGFDSTVAGPRTRNDRYDGYDAYDTYPPATAYTGPVNLDPGTPVNPYPNAPVGTNGQGRLRQISIPAGAVVPVILDEELSSKNATAGQPFTATIESKKMGDSEFPPGTKIRGRVLAVQPRDGDNPGTLELEFRAAILPDGTRVPFEGSLTALDDKSVSVSEGRITARAKKGSGVDLKVIGIGAGAGFVVGRLLKKDGVLPALIGALGGYLYGQSKGDKPADAVLPAGTRLGVRVDSALTYGDSSGYRQYRRQYLRDS